VYGKPVYIRFGAIHMWFQYPLGVSKHPSGMSEDYFTINCLLSSWPLASTVLAHNTYPVNISRTEEIHKSGAQKRDLVK
jgi:hypothetical protein